jgi:transcription elongation factor Elf1
MKALKEMSRNFTRDIKRPKKKASITARLCDLMSGGSRSSSSCTVDQTVEEATMMCDDASDISSSSSVCDSSRQAMELVVNADVAVDMSQLSQLSLVDEVNDTMEDATTGISLI